MPLELDPSVGTDVLKQLYNQLVDHCEAVQSAADTQAAAAAAANEKVQGAKKAMMWLAKFKDCLQDLNCMPDGELLGILNTLDNIQERLMEYFTEVHWEAALHSPCE